MRAPPARVGDSVDAIDTPALVIDLDAMDRNLAAMAGFARAHGVKLRPHAKMHKCAAIAALQIAAGAVGVCVQKVSEAEALAAAGIGDIYISNEVIAEAKLARVAALAGRVKLAIAVDSALGVQRLADALKAAGTTLEVFVEIDVGQGRCGVAPAAAGALAHQVVSHGQADRGMPATGLSRRSEAPVQLGSAGDSNSGLLCTTPQVLRSGLRFAGLQAYHGRAQHLRGAAEREAAIRHAVALVRAAQASVTSAGIACPLVTGAGTGSFVFEAASAVYGELQAGSYLFMDAHYAANEPAPHAPRFEHALFVKSQVMSRGASHAVVDAGHKSHAIDSGLPRVWSPAGGPVPAFGNGGDEHGILLAPDGAALPELGDTVWLVPGHCDPTVNLHSHFVGVRGGLSVGAVDRIWSIDARGCVF